MNLQYSQLNTLANTLNMQSRNKVLAAGVALAVASRLPVPSAPVEDVGSYFNLQIGTLFQDPISDFNEACVFDMKAAAEFVRMFWMLRYSACHPQSALIFAEQSCYGFFDTIAGCALHVGEAVHTFVNEEKIGIYQVCRQVLCYLGEPVDRGALNG